MFAAAAAFGVQLFGMSAAGARDRDTTRYGSVLPGSFRDFPNPPGTVFTSVSDLKSHEIDPDRLARENEGPQAVTVLGYYKKGDGGGGHFYWDASDLSAEVSSDPKNGIYIPPAGDPTGASGAWVRNFKGSVQPEWFGAVADGTNKRKELQAALDFFSSRKKNGEVVFTDLYRADAGLTQDIDYVSIRCTGVGGVDFSNADDSSPLDCWTLFASKGKRERLATENSSLLIIGPGRNGQARGFVFDGQTGPGRRRRKASGINMRGCVAREFNRGIEYRTGAYLIKWFGGGVNGAHHHVHIDKDFPDFGENFSFFGTAFANGSAGGCTVNIRAGNQGFTFVACSFDYVAQWIKNTGSSTINCYGCHFESGNNSRPLDDYPFYLQSTSGANIHIKGGQIFLGERYEGPDSLIYCEGAEYADNPWKGTTGMFVLEEIKYFSKTSKIRYWSDGNGVIVVRDVITPEVGRQPEGFKPQDDGGTEFNNLLSDGSFEKNTLTDHWYVEGGTRYTRTQTDYISLSLDTGNGRSRPNSNGDAKSGALLVTDRGEPSKVNLIVPVSNPRVQASVRFLLKLDKRREPDGNIFPALSWVNVIGFDPHQVPIIGRSEIIYQKPVDPERDASDWFEVVLKTSGDQRGSRRKYPWATHLRLNINSDVFHGTYWIDDVMISIF